jgi:hypothetical protein
LEATTKLLAHEDAVITGFGTASRLFIADRSVEALILYHCLMRVEPVRNTYSAGNLVEPDPGGPQTKHVPIADGRPQGRPGTEGLQTHCWRKPDSNRQYRVTEGFERDSCRLC